MIEDIGDIRRGSYGRHHGQRRPDAPAFTHLAETVRQVAVIGDTFAIVLARHLAQALDAGLLGLGPADRAAAFLAAGKAAQICPVRWGVLHGAPTIDDLRTAEFVVTDDPASVARLCLLRPTLLTQPKPRTGSIGSDVLIVWDGSDSAARAVRAVRPLLRDARHVRILARADADPTVANDILQEHGILASTDIMSGDTVDFFECVRQHVEAHGTDLLVSGRTDQGRQPAWSSSLPYPACAWFTA